MSNTAPLRILLVDADEAHARSLRRLLSAWAVPPDVEIATSFDAGRERMASSHFDVHLVASRLGPRSGIDLLHAHGGAGGEPPVILIGDEPADGEDLAALDGGAAGYLERRRLDSRLLERSILYAVEAARRAASVLRVRDELAARVAERTGALETLNAALVAEVADRRAAERALRDAERRKDEFLATLAHELRNPLAPLSSAVEVLSRSGEGPGDRDRRTRSLGVIERQVANLVRLIDDLLDISRITHGKLDLRRERVPLAAVVDRALETARPLLVARRQEFGVAMPEAEVLLHGDPMRLAQILSNLLSNAAKYTEPGGAIRLEAARAGDDVVVSVSDSGIGIPAGHIAHVFTMFGQGHRAHEPVYGGLGIGLALAKSLAELHGGTLTAASEGEGKGSVFTLRVPGAVAEAAPPSASSSSAAPPEPRRILVVDDNVEAALTLAELLTLEGHETHVAHDGPSAVDAARRLRPDAAILDIGLPGFDGLEVARRLRADPDLRGLFLVALSGWVQPEDEARSRDAGFDRHLPKPVPIRTLANVLRVSRDRVRTP